MNDQHTYGQTEAKMTEKEKIQRSKFAKGNGDKARTEENGQLYVYNYPLHIRNGNHTPKIQN